MPPSLVWEIVAGSFGVAAAILLVGGWLVVRYQRDKHQFVLMQTALQQGITHLPGAVPGWVISLRQGLLALVLGLGVALAGAVLKASASRIEPIPASVAARFQSDNPPPQRGERLMPPPPPGGDRNDGPAEGRGEPRRPPQDPLMERWHRMETQSLIGILAVCAGGILAMLGLVRILFARTERRYASELPGGTRSSGTSPPVTG